MFNKPEVAAFGGGGAFLLLDIVDFRGGGALLFSEAAAEGGGGALLLPENTDKDLRTSKL